MNEWQPIETAPKDGSKFLAFEPRFGPVVLFFGEYADDDGHPLWEDAVQEYWPHYQPTHWMPVPEPPASSPPNFREMRGILKKD